MISRRKFIVHSAGIIAGSLAAGKLRSSDNNMMTVNGWVQAGKTGFTLTHEHVLVDFAGAGKATPSRYNPDEVFRIAVSKLKSVAAKGCKTLIDCTPAYLGRDVRILKRLADATRLNILSNTGYYGAADQKYLPAHSFSETPEQLAKRWIAEWEHGIDGTGIKPGFIKSGVDNYPFTTAQQKIVEAAALTHLATGLTIGIHTGNGQAALEELRIIRSLGAGASSWVWIHAQNETNRDIHFRVAAEGGWVSFDGVSKESISTCLSFLKDMKSKGLLQQVLLSQDSGWYHVGEPGGGKYNDYNTIFDKLIPAMKENGFDEKDIRQLFIINPSRAFAVSIRKK